MNLAQMLGTAPVPQQATEKAVGAHVLACLTSGKTECTCPAPEPEYEETKARKWELFDYINALFRHQALGDVTPPQPFILHRFFASDKDYASAAKDVQLTTNDPRMVYEIWRAAVPRGRAPRFTYVGPKARPKAEGLIAALMERAQLRREVAEDAVHVLTVTGKLDEACRYYGVRTEEEEKADAPKPKRATRKKK